MTAVKPSKGLHPVLSHLIKSLAVMPIKDAYQMLSILARGYGCSVFSLVNTLRSAQYRVPIICNAIS
jgi:hypothetical protein